MLTISGGDRWRCEVPEDEWPKDEEVREAITRDFEGEWGDRRQEIVFIGQQMRSGGEQRLRRALDACLLDDEEFRQWEEIMRSENALEKLDDLFEDGFEDWLDEQGHHHDHDHVNDQTHQHSH